MKSKLSSELILKMDQIDIEVQGLKKHQAEKEKFYWETNEVV